MKLVTLVIANCCIILKMSKAVFGIITMCNKMFSVIHYNKQKISASILPVEVFISKKINPGEVNQHQSL